MSSKRSSFVSRLRERLNWIFSVTFQLGADFPSKIKLLFGGLWYLVNDTWKSSLQFTSIISHFGRTVRFHFNDLSNFGLFYETFLDNADEMLFLSEADIIFDLGANVGVSAAYFRLRYPDAKIYSFEPDPDNVKQLRQNAVFIGNMKVDEVAIWSSNGTLPFYVDPHRGSSSSTKKVRERQQKIDVETKTLEWVINQTGGDQIDILKFDIEGSEEEVFSSFEGFDSVRMLYGELHGDHCNADNVINVIREHFDQTRLNPLDIEDRWYLTAYRNREKLVDTVSQIK